MEVCFFWMKALQNLGFFCIFFFLFFNGILSITTICFEIHLIIYSFMYKSFIFGFLRPYHSKNEKYVKREICWSNLLVINFFCLLVFQLSNLVVVRLQLSIVFSFSLF
jgi:hypothetical protein